MLATPVQKVLDMMGSLKAKAEKALDNEQDAYASYKEWVSDRSKELGFEIETSKSSIERLVAFVEKAENKAAQLGKSISAADGDIKRLEGEKRKAKAVRDEEHAEYMKLQQGLSDSVDALESAIETLSTQAYDRPQQEALLQRAAASTPVLGRALRAFLQGGGLSHGTEVGAPEAAAYDFQSNGILELMEQLQKKFKRELEKTESEEAERAHYYELQEMHLSETIAQTKSDRDDMATTRAKTAAASAKANGELVETKKELAADKALLAEIKATFAAKSETFSANQKVRKNELTALSKAIEIISSPTVAGSYGEHVNLAQTSLLQTASSRSQKVARQRAVALLEQSASALDSSALESLATQASAGPFAKVVKMIEVLLARLKTDASAEADHKKWCDTQLKENKLRRTKRGTAVKRLTAEIESKGAEITTMGKRLEVLAEEQAQLTKDMGEATQMRAQEKAKNAGALKDAVAGAEAVKRALVVLREFYASQASLLQAGARQAPEMEAYKGLQGGSRGIIGMLEVVQSDFVRLAAETESAEQQAAREYGEFTASAKADLKRKHDAEQKLKLAKDQAEFQRGELQKDLDAGKESLAEANAYYANLKPSCLDVKVSFEERGARRKEEIAALKEAYSILDGKSSS